MQINDESSVHIKVDHGFPQVSVLDPILFTLYIHFHKETLLGLSENVHFYADDTQLYILFKVIEPNSKVKYVNNRNHHNCEINNYISILSLSDD